jgi:hypothetical protein
MTQINRITHPDGRTELASDAGTFTFERLRPGVLLVTITGRDLGQFGQAALDEIRMEMLRHQPLELLVDAEGATMVASGVNQAWTQFFANNRNQLVRVGILAGTKFVNLVVSIAQHLSQTGNLIQIHADRAAFDAARARAEAR